MIAPLDARAVADLLAERMPELARELLGEPSHRGRDTWRFRSRGSLAVEVAGAKRGSWYDHQAGEGGDAIGLVAHCHGKPMRHAYRWALAWLGIAGAVEDRPTPHPAPASPEVPREASPPATLDLARETWLAAIPAPGTPVESYLAWRGLRIEEGAPLRYHPSAWRNPKFGPRGPAMVALMTDPTDVAAEPCGVHVTYLRPDGSGKAAGNRQKIMLGRAGCIRLSHDEDVASGLGLAEGLETTLTVAQAFGWRPVWAATSAGAIARFPLLPGLEALTIFADADSAGAKAAATCAARWSAAGREVRIFTPPAGDFNDMLRGRAA